MCPKTLLVLMLVVALFRASPRQLYHQVIANGHSKLLDAWGASGGMPRVKA